MTLFGTDCNSFVFIVVECTGWGCVGKVFDGATDIARSVSGGCWVDDVDYCAIAICCLMDGVDGGCCAK